jgi:DNA processing protein
MTPHEAVVLAHVGWHHRRLRYAIARRIVGRRSEDDPEIPERGTAESIASWLCRLLDGAARRAGDARSPDSSSESRRARFTPASLDEAAASMLRRAADLRLLTLPLGTPEYPALLAEIPDPPPLLWARGQVSDLHGLGVAVVGSRAASSYGRAMARRLGRDLTAAGIVVISGLARGIDSAAHRGALASGGRTVAVLGSAHDRLYPPEHRELASHIEGAGAVVTEFPPGTAPRAHHFPLRNRIISGLARTVVVVEAPERSGALITATCALDQGRDVFVVPGPVLGERNRGGHALLRDGAKLAESADDILSDLSLPSGVVTSEPAESHPWLCQLTEAVDFTVDDVVATLGIPAPQVLAGLLELELAGRVQRVGGGRFVRCLPAC